MDIGSIFLILGLLALVGLFVARPFFEQSAKPLSQSEHEISALLAERDRVISALQELDFDFALGKIPDGEYPPQRAALLQHGADALRRLDALSSAELPSVSAAEDRIEAAIAERRASASRAAIAANGDDDLETLIASHRRARSEKAAGFCPHCGKPVQKSDKFCPKCGKPQA